MQTYLAAGAIAVSALASFAVMRPLLCRLLRGRGEKHDSAA